MTHPVRMRAIGLLAVLLIPGCAGLDRLPTFWSSPGGIAGRVERTEAESTTPRVASQAAPAIGPTLVYLEPVGRPSASPRRKPVEWLVIENGRQEPEIRLVRPDQPVRFRNKGAIHHELFALDPQNRFEARLEEGEESKSYHFRHPGLVKAFCRLHPSETYTLIVSDTVYFDQLDDESRYHISGVPAGEYRVRAASLDSQSEALTVHIVADETIERTLRLSAESKQ